MNLCYACFYLENTLLLRFIIAHWACLLSWGEKVSFSMAQCGKVLEQIEMTDKVIFPIEQNPNDVLGVSSEYPNNALRCNGISRDKWWHSDIIVVPGNYLSQKRVTIITWTKRYKVQKRFMKMLVLMFWVINYSQEDGLWHWNYRLIHINHLKAISG